MKHVEKECKAKGLIFKRCGRSRYKVMLEINDEIVAWICSSIKECNEAIFQAMCLKKWSTEVAA